MGPDPLRSLVDVLPVAACVHRGGRVLHANALFLAALGIADPPEVVGCALDALVRYEDRPAVEARWRALSAEAPSATPIAIGWLRRDGGTVTMRTSAARVPFEGEPAILELGPDAGDQGLLHARLASSDRLASVGTLAAGVAHEINNPLTYVLANLDFIREQLHVHAKKLPPEVHAELDEIAAEAKAGADRVARVVRSLKVFSRVDEDRRTTTDLIAMVEAALALASNEIRHRARLVKIYRPVPAVVGDEARLTQLFLNLLMNAAQAIPEGHADENHIHVKTWTDEGRAVVEIRDTGGGIRPEHLPRIFDPFFTTKPQGVGTGLGLAICHGTVTSLGGEIVVESTASLGSVFRVMLPGAPEVTAERPEPMRISTGRGRSGKILVIDDDVAIGAAIRRTLGRRHDVITTTSGREGLDRVGGGERFDLILCDLMMPVLTGMEFFAELERVSAEQAERVVFLTGGAFTHSAREFLDRITNQRFEKPFDAARLRMLAKTMVDDGPRPRAV
jgi:signal transduction histidine kinase/ActR/RegA family two-component response regulator